MKRCLLLPLPCTAQNHLTHCLKCVLALLFQAKCEVLHEGGVFQGKVFEDWLHNVLKDNDVLTLGDLKKKCDMSTVMPLQASDWHDTTANLACVRGGQNEC